MTEPTHGSVEPRYVSGGFYSLRSVAQHLFRLQLPKSNTCPFPVGCSLTSHYLLQVMLNSRSTSSKGFPSTPSQFRPWLVWDGQPKGSRGFSMRAVPAGSSQPFAATGPRAASLEVHSLTGCTETARASASTCKQRL